MRSTLFDQRSKEIAARLRPEVMEAKLPRGDSILESLVGMSFQDSDSTQTLARQLCQFSFG